MLDLILDIRCFISCKKIFKSSLREEYDIRREVQKYLENDRREIYS